MIFKWLTFLSAYHHESSYLIFLSFYSLFFRWLHFESVVFFFLSKLRFIYLCLNTGSFHLLSIHYHHLGRWTVIGWTIWGVAVLRRPKVNKTKGDLSRIEMKIKTIEKRIVCGAEISHFSDKSRHCDLPVFSVGAVLKWLRCHSFCAHICQDFILFNEISFFFINLYLFMLPFYLFFQ